VHGHTGDEFGEEKFCGGGHWLVAVGFTIDLPDDAQAKNELKDKHQIRLEQ